MSADGFTVILDVGGQSEQWDNVRIPLSERVPFFDAAPSARDVSIALAPRVIDLPALAAEGHDPSDALLRVVDGDDLLFAGRALGSLRWGRAGDWIRLTATESPWADSSLIPTPWQQRVTVVDEAVRSAVQSNPLSRVWPGGFYVRDDLRGDPESPPIVSALGYDLYVDKVEGRVGPQVFGAPGYQDSESWPATPAYWIDTTEGSERLQIARHRVAASTVTVYGPCVDGEIRGKVCDVAHTTTIEGVEVAVAEIGVHLGRGPRMRIEITNDAAGVYTVAGNLEFRDFTNTSTTTTPFSIVWNGSGSDITCVANFESALEADGLIEPWVSWTWENPTAGTLVFYVQTNPWAGSGGVPSDILVTTETAVGGASAMDPVTVEYNGVDVVQPTDFAPDLEADWGVAWTGGEASPGGAGDVIRWVLDQTRVRVDRSHVDSWRTELNRYTLAGCIDEQVDAVQWLATQLAWLPIGWVQGRDGLRLWVYDPEAPPVATLSESLGLDVDTDAGTTEAEPVARVELRYRVGQDRADGRLVTRQQTVWSELARGGEVVTLETDLCDDTATAERAAALRQRAMHARHLVVGGSLDRAEWSWLRAGDTVDVEAPSRGCSGRGMVLEVADDGGPRLRVELLVWRDREVRRSVFEVQPIPDPVPGLPTYPALTANYTLCEGVYDAPHGTGSWSTIYNRAGTGPDVEDLQGSGVSSDTGYAPNGETTIAVLTASDQLAAWLHPDTSPGPGDADGPYSMSSGGYLVSKQFLYDSRANGQDILQILRGGRGTGGAAVICLTLESRTGDDLVLVAWDGSGTTDIRSWSIPPEIQTGTGSKDSWILAGVRWDPVSTPQSWHVVVEVDLDDGAGRVVLIDDYFTESASDFDPLVAKNVTQIRQTAKGSFCSVALSMGGGEASFQRTLDASRYEVTRIAP